MRITKVMLGETVRILREEVRSNRNEITLLEFKVKVLNECIAIKRYGGEDLVASAATAMDAAAHTLSDLRQVLVMLERRR